MIAALYIDAARGPYANMPGIDAWGIERNATQYPGPHPVIAHPPCGPWGRFRWRCNDEPSTGPIAVRQVQQWGGVLEHPAHSLLWSHCGLFPPGLLRDRFGGWTLEVDQCRFGHPCEKLTWLYMVGVDPARIVLPPPRQPTHVIGDSDSGLPEIPKSQRHITPPAFAEWLASLVRGIR